MSPPLSMSARTLLIFKSAFAVAGVQAAEAAEEPPTRPPFMPTFSLAIPEITGNEQAANKSAFVIFILLSLMLLTTILLKNLRLHLSSFFLE